MKEIKKYNYDFTKKLKYWTPAFIVTRFYIKPTTPEEVAQWLEEKKKKGDLKAKWSYYLEGILLDKPEWKTNIDNFIEINNELKRMELLSKKVPEKDWNNPEILKMYDIRPKEVINKTIGNFEQRPYRKYKCYDGNYYVSFNQGKCEIIPLVYDIDKKEISYSEIKVGDLIRIRFNAYVSREHKSASVSFDAVQRFKHFMDIPELSTSVGEYEEELSEADNQIINSAMDFDEEIPF